jgi:hypothetical protein
MNKKRRALMPAGKNPTCGVGAVKLGTLGWGSKIGFLSSLRLENE